MIQLEQQKSMRRIRNWRNPISKNSINGLNQCHIYLQILQVRVSYEAILAENIYCPMNEKYQKIWITSKYRDITTFETRVFGKKWMRKSLKCTQSINTYFQNQRSNDMEVPNLDFRPWKKEKKQEPVHHVKLWTRSISSFLLIYSWNRYV